MTTKIKRLMLIGLAALLLAGGGLLALPVDEVAAGRYIHTTSETGCDPPN